MSGDWEDAVATATLKPVWKGNLVVSREPRTIVWWQAYMHVSGGLDLLHVGSRVLGREEDDEARVLSQRLLGGLVDMAWKSLGGEVGFEVTAVTWGSQAWGGKVIVRADRGSKFDPLMVAIQRLKTG